MASLTHAYQEALVRIVNDLLHWQPSTLGEWLKAYSKVKESPFSVAFMQAIGVAMEQVLGRAPRILDVGCGEMRCASCLMAGLQSDRVTYVSVDKTISECCEPITKGAKRLKQKVNWVHINKDIFDEDFTDAMHALNLDAFDIVMIDVEPHGNEIKVYERIKDYMCSNGHVCLLKHVGRIDLWGSTCAHKFLSKYISEQHVLDYYDIDVLNGHDFRDVYVIMGANLALDDKTQQLGREIMGSLIIDYTCSGQDGQYVSLVPSVDSWRYEQTNIDPAGSLDEILEKWMLNASLFNGIYAT